MFARFRLTAARFGAAAVALVLLAEPVPAQRKPSGAEVWGANCGRCHRVRAVDAYDARQWETIITHMVLVARLTPDETAAVREFLVSSARAREGRQGGAAAARAEREALRLASQAATVPQGVACCSPAVGRSLYEAQCAVCHGKSGKGDGPAAAAMNPRPPDITRTALPDDSLTLLIVGGWKGMPGFGQLLSADEIQEVVSYVQGLKQ